jgi:hypothetical protein
LHDLNTLVIAEELTAVIVEATIRHFITVAGDRDDAPGH